MSLPKFVVTAAATGALSIGSAAQASLSFPAADFPFIGTGLVKVPITTGALADDPNLANYNVYDLVVSISPDDHWASGDIRFQLDGGAFYIPPDPFQDGLDSDIGLQSIVGITGLRNVR